MAFSAETFKRDYLQRADTTDLVSQLPHLRKLANLYVAKAIAEENNSQTINNRWLLYVQVILTTIICHFICHGDREVDL